MERDMTFQGSSPGTPPLQGGLSMAAQLRVFPESDFADIQKPSIRVSLGELLPLIAVARRNNNAWLQDFLDDEVCITPDLYEVLSAFSSYRRPSA
jgi:hypothetical protein